MILQWEEWWEKSITRGTSGDMVLDILSDWKQERNDLLTRNRDLVEGIEKHREGYANYFDPQRFYTNDDRELYKLIEKENEDG